jgi:hypothetical protein
MPSKSILGLTALMLLAVATAGGARAEDKVPTEQYAKRMFAEKFAAAGKSYACFVRRYDATHLVKHPQQTVTAMRLLISAETLPEDKSLNYSFAMGLAFRNRPGDFASSGSCGHPAAAQESPDKLALGCGVDCDGGGIGLELVNADKAILLRVDSVAIWDNSKPDDERTSLEGGAEDRVFRLDRVKLDECKPLMDDGSKDDEKPATM